MNQRHKYKMYEYKKVWFLGFFICGISQNYCSFKHNRQDNVEIIKKVLSDHVPEIFPKSKEKIILVVEYHRKDFGRKIVLDIEIVGQM